jgi:hypothetical protein
MLLLLKLLSIKEHNQYIFLKWSTSSFYTFRGAPLDISITTTIV